MIRRFIKRKQNKLRGVLRTYKLIKLLDKLKKAYPNMYVEFSVIHSEQEWRSGFMFRGAIPWRDRKHTIASDSREVSLMEHLERTMGYISSKVDPLKKRV